MTQPNLPGGLPTQAANLQLQGGAAIVAPRQRVPGWGARQRAGAASTCEPEGGAD